MENKDITKFLDAVDLRGAQVPDRMLGYSGMGESYVCDCGACDDGGYCICDDIIIDHKSTYSHRE